MGSSRVLESDSRCADDAGLARYLGPAVDRRRRRLALRAAFAAEAYDRRDGLDDYAALDEPQRAARGRPRGRDA